jgi:hypothetical protein
LLVALVGVVVVGVVVVGVVVVGVVVVGVVVVGGVVVGVVVVGGVVVGGVVVAGVVVVGVVVVVIGPGAVGAVPGVAWSGEGSVVGVGVGSLPPSFVWLACASSMRILEPVISRITA